MRQFATIEKLDTAVLYTLELASSLSVLLLAFGLIASMANVLTKGQVLTHNDTMQQVWAWTQCIAIDASVAGTILRTMAYCKQHEWVKASVYTLLSVLLLFTAAIVSNIEAVQQTLNITLDSAYSHVFVSVEALIWIRSVAIVLLIVAHALRHVGRPPEHPVQGVHPKPLQPASTTVQPVQSEPPVQHEQATPPKALPAPNNENFQRVQEYLRVHPNASARAVGHALGMSATTANKWIRKVRNAS